MIKLQQLRKQSKKINLKTISAVCLLLVANTSFCYAQKFVLPVFPDTQGEVGGKTAMFYSQCNWIIQQKELLNIPIVLHVGDIVNFDNITHWENADKGFDLFDNANIPYAVCLGNHDTEAVGVNSGGAAPGNVNLNLRKTTKFNTYFPVSRFTTQKGRYEEGKSDNAYYTFEAGGLKWLVLSLEFCARQGPVDWANTIVSAYPTYNVIVLTHFHLDASWAISTSNAGYGDLSPYTIFNQFIKKHANILLVLSGHLGNSAYRVDSGDNGNKIYQILQDYQDQDSGGGYLRLLEIDTKLNTISAEMYSPFYNITKQDNSKFQKIGVKFITDVTENLEVYNNPNRNISVYPNPVKANQNFTVRISGISDNDLKDSEISLYNIQGIRVYNSTKVEQQNVVNLPPIGGLYTGHLVTDNGKSYNFNILKL